MPKRPKELPRGPMIHIRLDESTRRKLKIRLAHQSTTIQHLVANLIHREISELDKSTKE